MLDVAPERATALLDGIVVATERLLDFPNMGRSVRGSGPHPLREIIFENYRIVYTLDGSTIGIVTIVHGAMDIESRLRELGLSDT